ERVGVDPPRVPSVALGGGDTDRALARPADPDRRDGGGRSAVEQRAVHRGDVLAAGPRPAGVQGPERADALHEVLTADTGAEVRQTERIVLAPTQLVPRADPEHEPAAAHVVEHRDLLR